MKLKGTVTRSDLEGGHWLLNADDGAQYQLKGDTARLTNGAKVEVEGSVDKDAFGIGMTGAFFTVKKLKTL